MAFFPQDDTQDVSGLPANDAMAQLELQRRLKIAQQLQQSKVPEGQMISGHYVAPSWTQQLASAYGAYKGRKAEEEALKGYGEYTKSKETKMAEALKKLGGAFEPKTITSTEMQTTEGCLKLSDNQLAKIVELPMELWLQHTVINFEMVKVEDLNHMIIESQPFVTIAIWNLTKARKWTRINGFNSLKMLTEIQSVGYLKTDTLKLHE